jgi:hypothetical protein
LRLNGPSLLRGNPYRGFEMMKTARPPRGCSGSTQDAPPRWRDVNPDAAARTPRSSSALPSRELPTIRFGVTSSAFFVLARENFPKRRSKCITAVDNAMTAA